MKTKLAVLGAVLVLVLTAFLDSSPKSSKSSIFYNFSYEDSIDADVQVTQRSASYTHEFLLEDMKEVNGFIVETYREYQVHKDRKGHEIVRIPTENYQYLKYEKE